MNIRPESSTLLSSIGTLHSNHKTTTTTMMMISYYPSSHKHIVMIWKSSANSLCKDAAILL